MRETRTKSEFVEDIAVKLIQEDPELEYIKNSNVKIIYLVSDLAKKSGQMVVNGQCEKVADKYRWAIDADFTITLFTPNTVGMDDTQLMILVKHELLHIGIDGDKYGIAPHTLQDFKSIVREYGVDWAQR